MRFPLILVSVLLLSSPALAQYYSSSTRYNVEPWDEDWSYLKDPTQRSDFFDPIKFVPVNASGDSYVSFGGQLRDRYDYFNNTNFGAGVQDENGFNLIRILAHADIHFGPNLRFYIEGNSGMIDDRAGGGRPGDADELDLQQAFGDIRLPFNDADALLLRVGRQELIYGAQRLISPNDWGNVRRTFEGAKLELTTHNNTLDLFWVRPVVIEKETANTGDGNTSFAGIYNVTALPDFIEGADSRIELYFLALNQTASATLPVDTDTYTLGGRFKTTPGAWDFDIEPDFQFGDTGGSTIKAWAFATQLGYTFEYATFSPHPNIGLDIASGSEGADHRFNQLYPPLYTYLGHLYLFGRQNIIDAHGGVDLHLTDAVTLSLEHHVFWRQNLSDGLYNLSGAVVRADTGSDSAYVGNEFDIVVNWQINQHLSAYLGYAHFFSGSFIEETGPSKDVDFLYAAATFTF